jgi:hypothetical protein
MVLASACQSGATPGAACTHSSECASPLVCRLGRCRSECNADRDCPTGARCYFANEVGVCELPAIDVCDTQSCAPPLACRGGHCTQLCATASECGGGACAAGACERANDDGGVIGDGGVVRRATCLHDTDCPTGSACTSLSGTMSGVGVDFYCRPMCMANADCVARVGPGSACVGMAVNDNLSGSGTCSVRCHVAPDDCALGDTCRITSLLLTVGSAYVDELECSTAGPRAIGDPCGNSDQQCPAHSNCVGGVCVALCVRGTSGACTPPTQCQQYGSGPRVVDGVEWGFCQ